MATADVPPYHELLWPTPQAVTEPGGSAPTSEIAETVIRRQAFSDAQQAVLHNNGPEAQIGYRLAWARFYIKGISLLTNSSRGIWALTNEGTALLTGQRRSGYMHVGVFVLSLYKKGAHESHGGDRRKP